MSKFQVAVASVGMGGLAMAYLAAPFFISVHGAVDPEEKLGLRPLQELSVLQAEPKDRPKLIAAYRAEPCKPTVLVLKGAAVRICSR